MLSKWVIPIAVILLIAIAIFYALFKGVWQERYIYIKAYKSLESFKKVSLKTGLIYYLIIPLLNSHPAKDTYIGQVSINILTAIANALFVLGVIALLEKCHEINKEEKGYNNSA